MLIVVYDKLVEPSNQDPSKIILCILATLLTQDKCDIFNEPVYCLHFWLSWQWKLVEVWYFSPLVISSYRFVYLFILVLL